MTDTPKDETAAPEKGERIAKTLARSGLCSRREAERWIEAGRVSVDGTVLTSAAVNVTAGNKITVDGRPLPQREPVRLWRYHKPRGLVTSHRDPEGRPTVFEKLKQSFGTSLPRVISVGRLDLNSEGLLLLTNDGDLARALESPKTGWMRRYRVRVNGRVTETALTNLKDGVTVEGVHYGPIEAKLESRRGANAWIVVGIAEGKNREIRRVMEHLGLQVTRLIRLSYGPIQLGTLEAGHVREVLRPTLIDQVGHLLPELADEKAATRKKTPGAGWAKAKPKAKPSHKRKRKPGAPHDGKRPPAKRKGPKR